MARGASLSADEWRAVRDLFEQALERGDGADAWVRGQPAAEPVKAEALSLLEHHSRAGAFLDPPVSGRIADLLSEAPTLEPGTHIGHYAIQRELGRGGMGCVYLATDTRLGRDVALKAIAPHLTWSDDERARLRKEARAAAQLSHPGICIVYSLEEIDGEHYIVSEFIEGQTLRGEIASGTLPAPDAVCSVARELASALSAAHARGIVHRDLKPENVMRGRDGHVKILDFGLARVDGGSFAKDSQPGPFTTEAWRLAGTPAYMAPEQLNGGRVDARTDLFQLGVLVYEYACGAHPFRAPTVMGTSARILEGAPEPMHARRSDLPGGVHAVVERCLQKHPGARFQSAGELLATLAVAVPHRSPTVAWWRTHQLVVIALYVGACVLAWHIKEWQHGVSTAAFLGMGAAATIGGIFRGHLVFTERVNRSAFGREWRKASGVLLAVDLVMAVLLGVDGGIVAVAKPLTAVFTFALGLGVALARVVLEPVTTQSTFPDVVKHASD